MSPPFNPREQVPLTHSLPHMEPLCTPVTAYLHAEAALWQSWSDTSKQLCFIYWRYHHNSCSTCTPRSKGTLKTWHNLCDRKVPSQAIRWHASTAEQMPCSTLLSLQSSVPTDSGCISAAHSLNPIIHLFCPVCPYPKLRLHAEGGQCMLQL